MTKWSYLNGGNIIDVIATTPGIGIANLEKDLSSLTDFIKEMGLTPRIDFDAILGGATYFSKAAQEVREKDLHRALLAKDSKVIWCIRGGYGTSKLLKNLENLIPPFPKLLIGYSDINCLHLWVNKFWQWPSLHARVLYEFLQTQNQLEIDALKNIIFGKVNQVEFNNLIPLNNLAKHKQNIHGKITGGTIQVLQSGIGLPWQFDSTDKILFFEEIFDRGVRLDRTLDHFLQLKLLKGAKAIIFGDILCGKESDGLENCDLAIKHFAQNIDIPILSVAGIGHGNLNFPLPLNSDAELILDGKLAKLICSTGGSYV